jgi:2,3-diketo-5-methylthio-1-phosphopentane phosphatase
VFVDFDGTIVPADATDQLLTRFADPSWLEIEADWKEGRIGSRECMARQVDLIRATPNDYDAFVAGVALDPAFPEFVEICRTNGIAVTVVSDGLDRTIAAVLGKARLDVPYYANRLEYLGASRWRLGFPHGRNTCRTLSGNCKCQFPDAAREAVHVMIGDGRSDFCIAGRVDIVLAKGALAAHCREKGLSHHPIEDFRDAVALFSSWLDDAVTPLSMTTVQNQGAAK